VSRFLVALLKRPRFIAALSAVILVLLSKAGIEIGEEVINEILATVAAVLVGAEVGEERKKQRREQRNAGHS
jgi:hypothetical protein